MGCEIGQSKRRAKLGPLDGLFASAGRIEFQVIDREVRRCDVQIELAGSKTGQNASVGVQLARTESRGESGLRIGLQGRQIDLGENDVAGDLRLCEVELAGFLNRAATTESAGEVVGGGRGLCAESELLEPDVDILQGYRCGSRKAVVGQFDRAVSECD